MSMTASAERLDKKRPDASLLGKKTICSVFGMLILQIVGQLIILRMCNSEIDIGRNIEYFKKNGRLRINSVEADALFTFTNFLYIGGILSVSFAKKYKKKLHKCNMIIPTCTSAFKKIHNCRARGLATLIYYITHRKKKKRHIKRINQL